MVREREQSGTTWFHGKDQMQAMKEHRLTQGHRCAVSRQKTGSEGYYSCASYPDWPTCLRWVERIPSERRHVHEVVIDGEAFKPYGDLDLKKKGMPEGYTAERVLHEVTQELVSMFKREFGVQIGENNVVWAESHKPEKWSWHFTIVSSPQPVFTFTREAKYMGRCLREAFPQFPPETVDLSVYSSNQNLMRMVGSSKHDKGGSVFKPLEGTTERPKKDYIITWIEPGEQTIKIKLPIRLPTVLKGRKKGERPIQKLADVLSAPVLPSPSKLPGQIFDVVKKLHPTAYQWQGADEADVRNRERGMKFNYSDRAESCYTGEIHDGKQNFRAWVDDNGDVFCKCFSEKCTNDFHLGNILQHNEERDYESTAVHIKRSYLKPMAGQPVPNDAMTALVPQFVRGEFKALSVKSVMATGKTYWLTDLLAEHFAGKTVLFVTYRQSLAIEITSRFTDFTNYMDTNDWLDDRTEYPRVICQLDSLYRLGQYGEVPRFDIIILDEVTSLLNHFSARTIDHPRNLLLLFGEMLKAAGKVIALDALYDDQTFHFFRDLGLSQRVIVNDYRGPPRTFVFSNDQERWFGSIVRDLGSGKNVAVVTMSTETGYKLVQQIAEKGTISEEDIVMHTSKSDDRMKEGLRNVTSFWRKRLLIYSPTIEAGVDFNIDHFDRLYVYCCLRSTTPLGLTQMTGRIRRIKDRTVRCCVTKNMSLDKAPQRVTLEDSKQAIRWLYTVGRNRRCDPTSEEPQIPSFPLEYQRTEGGGMVFIPEDSVVMNVIAANEARYSNGQRRFFFELKSLLEENGHRVSTSSRQARFKVDGEKPLTKKGQMLLSIPPVSDEEHAEIRYRMEKNQASERDKWQDYVTAYRRSWGIRNVTEAFIRSWGTECGSEAVNLVVACLVPNWTPASEVGHIARDSFPVKMRVLREVVTALGLKNILDHITTFDVEERREQLMGTSLFREWNQTYKLFQPQRKTGDNEFSMRRITDTLRSVFKACKLVMQGDRDQAGGGERRDYSLGKDECKAMLELAALKYRTRRTEEREYDSGSADSGRETQGNPAKDPGFCEILEDVEIEMFSSLI